VFAGRVGAVVGTPERRLWARAVWRGRVGDAAAREPKPSGGPRHRADTTGTVDDECGVDSPSV